MNYEDYPAAKAEQDRLNGKDDGLYSYIAPDPYDEGKFIVKTVPKTMLSDSVFSLRIANEKRKLYEMIAPVDIG